MADPNTTTKLMIMVGDGASTETFGWPCGANANSVKFTNNLGEDTLLDCTDPLGVAPTIARYLESQDTQVTISGKLSTDALAMWRGWSDDGVKKNIRIVIDEAAASGGGYWTVPAFLQDFELSRENQKTVDISATLIGGGRRVWTDAT